MADSRSDITVLIGGDCGPAHGPDQGVPVEHPIRQVAPVLAAADVRFVNCMRTYTNRSITDTKAPQVAQPVVMADLYSLAGFDGVTMANNHAYDCGPDAMLDTVALFRARGIQVTGAGGNLGSETVARAAPDGHTLVLGVTGSHGINVSLRKDMRYDPRTDFEPITQATLYPNAITVNNTVPANTLQELIALIQKGDTQYAYGSDGNGTASHLGMELLKHRAGLDLPHVPYRGGTPMVTDLLGGQIQIGITGLPAVQAHAKNQRLKILALTTGERFANAPDYPTVAEQGFPGFAAAPWSGFFAPKDTPKPIVEKISADMRSVMSDPALKERIAAAGSAFTPSTPEQAKAFIAAEIAKWAEAVKISGARVD